MADDGVIEAVEDPSRPFYVGVQWHPERSPKQSAGGDGVILALVEAARAWKQSSSRVLGSAAGG